MPNIKKIAANIPEAFLGKGVASPYFLGLTSSVDAKVSERTLPVVVFSSTGRSAISDSQGIRGARVSTFRTPHLSTTPSAD
jgi:hypothetical protein